MKPMSSIPSTRVRQAVRAFVLNRASDFPISIADLAKRVRYAFPSLSATERELADLIASEIIKAGGNVSFDTNTRYAIATLGLEAGEKCGAGDAEVKSRAQ